MLALKNLFSTSNAVETDDLKGVKNALNRLGYYMIPPHRGIDDWTDDATFDGLKRFQRDNGLKVDGLMRPGGPTETAINRTLRRVSSPGGGIGNSYPDLMQRRNDAENWPQAGDSENRNPTPSFREKEETFPRQDGSLMPKVLGGLRWGWDAVVDKWDYLQETLENAKDAPANLVAGYWGNAQETGDVVSDFRVNHQDMTEAGFIGGDKYFHCKANCQASQKGEQAERSAEALSNIREVYGFFKGDPRWDSVEDQEANKIGRKVGKEYPDRSCRDLCRPYRPKGLPRKY